MHATTTKTLLATVMTAALLGLPVPVAQARDEPSGLWSPSFKAGQKADECGRWRLDSDGFCVADDSRNGLEVGVKFQTSQALEITGVRIYRVDLATVRASLWDAAGNLLARGTFAPRSSTGWQDMSFDAPVSITPGTTYIASYRTPGTKYAFDYGYFADTARTVGPVTALRSEGASPNGVHCYDDAPCGSFPVRGFKDSSYFVTPLWQTPSGVPTTEGPGTDRRAPRVSVAVPGNGARRVATDQKVRLRFSEAVRPATVRPRTVVLRGAGSARPVAATVRYDARRNKVVLDPRADLRPGTTYQVTVTRAVRDLAGNRLDQDAAKAGGQPARWSFRTR